MPDKIMNYDEATYIVEKEGWEVFFNLIDKEYPTLELFDCSMGWYQDDQYICKFKGAKGDLIIDWEHKQEKEMIQCC